MATAIFVQGPVLIQTGTGGAGALETLGISEDGVEPDVRRYLADVKADTGGPNIPVEMQDMGSDAVIRMTLPIFDAAVLTKIQKHAGQATPGLQPAMGTLVQTGGFSFRLLLKPTATNACDPLNFLNAWLRNSQKVKLGTRRTVWNLEFYAWAAIGVGTTSSSVVLYNTTTT